MQALGRISAEVPSATAAGHRMARIGEAVRPFAAGRRTPPRRPGRPTSSAADRQVAGGQSLGDRHGSGSMPKRSAPHQCPCGQSRRSPRRRPAGRRTCGRCAGSPANSSAGGIMTPPAPWTGSPMKAATSRHRARRSAPPARVPPRPNSSGVTVAALAEPVGLTGCGRCPGSAGPTAGASPACRRRLAATGRAMVGVTPRG